MGISVNKQSEYDGVKIRVGKVLLYVSFETDEYWYGEKQETESCEVGGEIVCGGGVEYELESCEITNLNILEVLNTHMNITIGEIVTACSVFVAENSRHEFEDNYE